MSDPTGVTIVSFGYLHGPPPPADITVDLRKRMRDPHTDPAMRELTGADETIVNKVHNTPGASAIAYGLADLVEAMHVDSVPLTVAIGCAGGRHRSHVMAHWVAELIQMPAVVVHRDVHLPVAPRGDNIERTDTMGKKDDRSKAEREAWEAGAFTEAEAAEVGTTAAKLNEQRAQAERELGNELAPPAE